MNIIDYLDWRGDIEMSCKPFNEVDNLILSELAYVHMDGLVSDEFEFDTSLANLLAKYRVARMDQQGALNDPIPLLEKAAYCERFQNVRVGAHVSLLDQDSVVQFSATTFKLDDETIYVAFRGTDHTMTGWQEDFNFGYLSETPGQAEAVAYLNKAIRATGCKAYVGGHSKGGNFAVYAAAFATDEVKEKYLLSVFSNDGPGFKKSIVDSENYASILDKIVKIVPESSIIGMILFGKEEMKIIESDGKGLDQHSPYRWHVQRDAFVPTNDLTYSSVFMDVAFDRWVEALDDEQRKIFISTVFDSIRSAGYTSMNDILSHKLVAYNAITKAAKKLDPDVQKSAMDSLKKLASISKDVLWDDAKKKFNLKRQAAPKDSPAT